MCLVFLCFTRIFPPNSTNSSNRIFDRFFLGMHLHFFLCLGFTQCSSIHPSIHHKLFWGWTPSRPNLSAGKPTGGCAGQAPTLRVPGPAIGAGGGRALPAVPAAAVPVSSGAAPRAGDVHAPPPGARPGPDRSAGRRHQRVGCAAAFFPDLCGTPTLSSSRVDLWVDDWLRQRCLLSSTSLRGHGTS